jgi:hypothetical protein
VEVSARDSFRLNWSVLNLSVYLAVTALLSRSQVEIANNDFKSNLCLSSSDNAWTPSPSHPSFIV